MGFWLKLYTGSTDLLIIDSGPSRQSRGVIVGGRYGVFAWQLNAERWSCHFQSQATTGLLFILASYLVELWVY